MNSSSEEEEREPQRPLYFHPPGNSIPRFWFSKKEVRNWVELPSDVMCMIFTKVGTIDILLRVQLVCSTWRKLAKEPHLFRSIDIIWEEIPDELRCSKESDHMIEKLVKEAVDRSCGQLVDFSIEDFATDELLKYIMDKQCPLRRLRFKSCDELSDSAFKYMAKKHPLLEELEICYCEIGYSKMIENFGRSCPLLKSFRFNRNYRKYMSDNIALAIAQSMPELRHLNLSGGNLTDNGLQAILDGCLHLNFLDLSHCSYLEFAGGLVQMCVERNIELKVSGKEESLRLITEMERRLSSLLQLQYNIPLYESLLQLQYEKPHHEHLEAGVETDDEELDDALSSYIKALHHTLTQLQSQKLHTLTQMVSQLQKLYQVQPKIYRESFEVYARRLGCICKI